jgi:hypothetical protein
MHIKFSEKNIFKYGNVNLIWTKRISKHEIALTSFVLAMKSKTSLGESLKSWINHISLDLNSLSPLFLWLCTFIEREI